MNGDIGLTIVLILTIIFIVTFLYGKSRNIRRANIIWRELSKVLKNVFKVSRVGYRSFGSSGYQVLLLNPSKEIKRYEITVVLLDRENIIHYIIQRIRGVKDMLVIKEEFTKKIDGKLDIYNVRYRRAKGGTPLRKYPYLVYSYDKGAKDVWDKILSDIIFFRNILVSFSLSRDSPNLVLTVYYDEDQLSNLILFSKRIAKIV